MKSFRDCEVMDDAEEAGRLMQELESDFASFCLKNEKLFTAEAKEDLVSLAEKSIEESMDSSMRFCDKVFVCMICIVVLTLLIVACL